MTARLLTASATQYHQDALTDQPTLSKSIIHTLLSRSPLHAKTAHPRLNPDYVREDEPKFDLGTVVHALLLQGLEVAEVLNYPDWRTKAAQEAGKLARAHGRIPMLLKDWTAVQEMHQAVAAQLERHPVRPIPFTDGQPEQTIVWEEQGVWCRCRLDWLWHDRAGIDDLKTSHSANPDVWTRRTMWDIGADLQAVLYSRAVKALTGQEPEFRFVVCETKPPYALSVVGLTPEARELAERKVDYALGLWKDCLAADSWPGYPTQIAYAEPPGWAESQWLERELREVA